MNSSGLYPNVGLGEGVVGACFAHDGAHFVASFVDKFVDAQDAAAYEAESPCVYKPDSQLQSDLDYSRISAANAFMSSELSFSMISSYPSTPFAHFFCRQSGEPLYAPPINFVREANGLGSVPEVAEVHGHQVRDLHSVPVVCVRLLVCYSSWNGCYCYSSSVTCATAFALNHHPIATNSLNYWLLWLNR